MTTSLRGMAQENKIYTDKIICGLCRTSDGKVANIYLISRARVVVVVIKFNVVSHSQIDSSKSAQGFLFQFQSQGRIANQVVATP